MPTLDEVISRFDGAKYFTKLDAHSGYWTIKLESESSYLTTFNSPFGRYRLLRMPFGLISAQDEFQRKIDETFGDMNNVFALVDDILVTGKTQEYNKNLRDTLDCCIKKNVKLNPDKLTVGATEVHYFGHIISAEGLKPDPAKVVAIDCMNNKQERARNHARYGHVP